MAGLTFRKAERKDCRLILEFIRKLADYEKRLDEVVATESDIEKWVFDEKLSHVIFGELDGKTIGFALYYLGFSTYMGNANMHLEDLLIEPEYRGRGYGKAFLKELGRIMIEEGYGRLEWTCLDWNKPSIEFYRSIGAEQKDWLVFHFSKNAIEKFIKD